LVEENDMTILLVEQYVDFVKEHADEFLVMNRGLFVSKGTVDRLDTQTINKHLSI
jgi:urea transport system ATP-binding protein